MAQEPWFIPQIDEGGNTVGWTDGWTGQPAQALSPSDTGYQAAAMVSGPTREALRQKVADFNLKGGSIPWKEIAPLYSYVQPNTNKQVIPDSPNDPNLARLGGGAFNGQYDPSSGNITIAGGSQNGAFTPTRNTPTGLAGFTGDLGGFLNDSALSTPAGRATMLMIGGLSAAGAAGAGEAAGGLGAGDGAFLGATSDLAPSFGGAGASALPDSYWSALADGGATATDAAAANAGTIGGATDIPYDVGANLANNPTAFGGNSILDSLSNLPNIPSPPTGGGGSSSNSPASLPATTPVSTFTPPADAGATLANTFTGNAATNLTGGAGTALSRTLAALSGGTTPDSADLLQLGLQAAPGVIGAITSSNQTSALQDIANQEAARRAPFLNKATGYLNNPSSFYTSPEATGASDALLRKLSIGGNPADSPSKLGLGTGALYGQYLNTVNSLGSLGLSGNTSQLQTNAVTQSGNTAADLGAALSGVTNPQTSLTDLLKQYGNSFGINWSGVT